MKNIYMDSSMSFSLIVLLLILTFALIVSVILIVKSKKDEKISEGHTLFKWVEKKDILYWLLIICLGAISVITYEYSGDKDALSHWSFAGTIVSIILAVVAIGFTLFQTLASNLSSEKISVSAEKIEKASAGLDASELLKAGEIITNVSKNILNFNEKLQEQVHELNDEIKSLKNEQKEHYTKINSLFDNKMNGSSRKDKLIFDLSEEDFAEKIYANMPEIPQFFMYSIYRFNEENIEISTIKERFLKAYSECVQENAPTQFDEQYVSGANLGSWGSTRSWMKHLGYDGNSETIPEEVKSAFKKKGVEYFKGEELYIDFLENFIKEESNH